MRAIDPVCGMSVETEKASAQVEHEGTVYYFCNAGCAKAFTQHPEEYVAEKGAEPQEHGACCGGHGHHHEKKDTHGHQGGGCCHH